MRVIYGVSSQMCIRFHPVSIIKEQCCTTREENFEGASSWYMHFKIFSPLAKHVSL